MGPSKYLLERSRSGKVTKIPCRTGGKKEIVSRQFGPAGRVLIYSKSRVPQLPGARSFDSTQARSPFPNPCPHLRDRGGGPRDTLSARPSSAPPEQGNVPPRSTSPHLAKAVGPALRGKKGLVCGLFASAGQPDILGLKPGLNRVPSTSEPQRAGAGTARGGGKRPTQGRAPSVAPGK